jgi:hypothetical protein
MPEPREKPEEPKRPPEKVAPKTSAAYRITQYLTQCDPGDENDTMK